MSAATTTMGAANIASSVRKFGKKKLLILVVPIVLIGAGIAAWFTGLVSALPGMRHAPLNAIAAAAPVSVPVYVEMPEIVANLNAGGRRSSFVKLQARLELSRPEDVAAFTAAQPRVMDLFQTYLREMRPDELRGSMGTYRLREQLIARASLAAAPARIVDVLFTELLVQ
jgi:flagellar FliL protein